MVTASAMPAPARNPPGALHYGKPGIRRRGEELRPEGRSLRFGAWSKNHAKALFSC
ncbi:hypothetical protein ACFOEY_13475 [Paracandidimonas soli]|uniref:hypothetical protein n=1 Tax=Paracandidimonas soli TaxID=1917182 RepID=UPI003620F6E9